MQQNSTSGGYLQVFTEDIYLFLYTILKTFLEHNFHGVVKKKMKIHGLFIIIKWVFFSQSYSMKPWKFSNQPKFGASNEIIFIYVSRQCHNIVPRPFENALIWNFHNIITAYSRKLFMAVSRIFTRYLSRNHENPVKIVHKPIVFYKVFMFFHDLSRQ